MYKHPMLSVKEAAAALGCDERWIREKLNQGQLKGEKKNIGMKEKWFVYKGEIDAALARKGPPGSQEAAPNLPAFSLDPAQTNFAPQSEPAPYAGGIPSQAVQVPPPILPQQQNQLVETQPKPQALQEDDSSEVVDAELDVEARRLELIAEKLIKPLTEQLNLRDKELQQASYRLGYLEGKMEDQEEQIKLLPDYQSRAEEGERLKIEAEQAKLRAAELEKISEIREHEMEALRKQVAAVEAERQAAEEAKAKAEALAQELEVIKATKEAEAKASQEQLAALTSTMEQLKKPWWKKMLSSD